MKILDVSIATWWLLAVLSLIAGCASDRTKQHPQPQTHQQARNIILFIGDGMGVSTVTAARILDGQLRGESGEENLLSFEHFPHVAMAKTYNTNQQTPDSAGSMSAIMTGEKTRAGVISVNQYARRSDCAGATGKNLPTFLEQAQRAGKAVGVVTTARLTHATPAATYAHSPERKWEGDQEMPPEAIQEGCKDMALQLVEFAEKYGMEVAMGGGRQYFIPQNISDPEDPALKGSRADGRNLIAEWQAAREHSTFIWNEAQFDKLNVDTAGHVLGLFNYSHMQYESDRKMDAGGEPSLSQMTAKAIELLDKNEEGFFLMVEAGRIDHAHHAGNAYRALTDTIELSNAVTTARKITSAEDTLIIVTADHSQVFTLAGYPTRGNPILGNVISNDEYGEPKPEPELAADGKPYTTVGYQNGPGYSFDDQPTITSERRAPVAGRDIDLGTIDTQDKRFHQQVLVPLKSETHGGEDVTVYADGPGAFRVHGVIEQNMVYHIMQDGMGLPESARD